jgi:hypothetical protein
MTESDSAGKSVTATIFIPASFTNSQSEVLSVELGSSIDLSSPISTDSYPQPQYIVWTKDNEYLVEGPILHLKNITSDMSGLYEIALFNGYGEPAAKYYKINVCKEKSVHVTSHSQSFLNCKWYDSPTRSVLESTDGKELPDSNSCKFFSSSLHYTAFATVFFLLY